MFTSPYLWMIIIMIMSIILKNCVLSDELPDTYATVIVWIIALIMLFSLIGQLHTYIHQYVSIKLKYDIIKVKPYFFNLVSLSETTLPSYPVFYLLFH